MYQSLEDPADEKWDIPSILANFTFHGDQSGHFAASVEHTPPLYFLFDLIKNCLR
jgi:hypothetical protein